jgi:hypothetical protein
MSRKARLRKNKAPTDRLPRQPLNAQRNYERYLDLARVEAQRGDPVAAEYYLQHAEHYLRSMQEERAADNPRRGR